MRLAKSSIAVFLIKIFVAVIGFLGTWYAARVVGAEGLGVFYLFTAVVSGLSLFTSFGIGSATTKRVSEGREQGEFLGAAFLMNLGLYLVTISIALIFKDEIIGFIGYEPAYYFIFIVLLFKVFKKPIKYALKGERRVATGKSLSLVSDSVRVGLWVVLLTAGAGVFGLVVGYVVGYLAALAVGLFLISIRLKLPSKRHFKSIFDYSKYSWLGSIESKAFSWTDTIVLGLFVAPAYIGIYEVAWSISGLFYFVAGAIGSVLFPNVSHLASKGKVDEIRDIIEEALIYVPIIAFPGLVGAAVVGEGVLRLYGEEFTIGYIVLTILILARIGNTFKSSMTKIINGMDRPDLSFRVYVVFLVLNLSLNFVLVYLFGWVGAAVATAFSITVAALIAYYYLNRLISIKLPFRELGKEVFAALIMGLALYPLSIVLSPLLFFETIFLVVLGTLVYFGVLLLISTEIRVKLHGLSKTIYMEYIKG
ncbi:MATE family membrane protein Rfbx family AglR [Methanonatronarchaeum thermophilum]|uniref:MATE family membrane protein Rfbx family AglR n=1 Tax=Methanonatronarchaeum thermophilum TaxID=1927129 RepID=A0A1Y3GDA2_9EURY|nr:polysaccharide biosynthesis C-terminal domain-containing protein [Methanonatronarchaeum thermophilum]OUJ19217.1 MATE family membrane protein Rfbx family AglR [Methanonatronarchaeum thermophilum]